jgi:hypothetical protein
MPSNVEHKTLMSLGLLGILSNLLALLLYSS